MLIIYDRGKSFGVHKNNLHSNCSFCPIGAIIFDTETNKMYQIDDFTAPWNVLENNQLYNNTLYVKVGTTKFINNTLEVN